jgi:hypothetical protein
MKIALFAVPGLFLVDTFDLVEQALGHSIHPPRIAS